MSMSARRRSRWKASFTLTCSTISGCLGSSRPLRWRKSDPGARMPRCAGRDAGPARGRTAMSDVFRATIPYESLDPLTIGAADDDSKVYREVLEIDIPQANL